MGPSVYEVAHKEVIGIWTLSSNFKELLQIVKLTVNIATNLQK